MTAHERANLVLAFAKSLCVDGQATEQMVDAAKRLGRALGLRITIIPRWGELQLVAYSEDAVLAVQAVASPVGVEMDRVSVDDASDRRYYGGAWPRIAPRKRSTKSRDCLRRRQVFLRSRPPQVPSHWQ
jgi:hypothetical protein